MWITNACVCPIEITGSLKALAQANTKSKQWQSVKSAVFPSCWSAIWKCKIYQKSEKDHSFATTLTQLWVWLMIFCQLFEYPVGPFAFTEGTEVLSLRVATHPSADVTNSHSWCPEFLTRHAERKNPTYSSPALQHKYNSVADILQSKVNFIA